MMLLVFLFFFSSLLLAPPLHLVFLLNLFLLPPTYMASPWRCEGGKVWIFFLGAAEFRETDLPFGFRRRDSRQTHQTDGVQAE